ncbi:hypothetical protein XBP1_690001 [Xenorhabdus bovienii str. puntauvense]|uniref:Uncharacterized protein n=1 Tax=Xenorhabdus bovienii str. puntauvense TaxID=1398201 RepID=A0A077NL39_XENBV|nr:hypothetical protein XBFFR1_430001 [Xenorhabdus bovienii str. feltiae France]CDG94615.1 hypothetical protein XBFFL1_780001 [Xenorhabdus bovienii str. feltiae Florida]CDG99017.1 hypothetical protein XBP1_690001 [Xenorhabdus bovienii str. puntauvense]
MNIYKLSHHYSLLHSFYGIKTDMNFHNLNLICAYLQLIRNELPELKGVEDVLGEDNGSALLATVCGMDIIREKQGAGSFSHLHTVWLTYLRFA